MFALKVGLSDRAFLSLCQSVCHVCLSVTMSTSQFPYSQEKLQTLLSGLSSDIKKAHFDWPLQWERPSNLDTLEIIYTLEWGILADFRVKMASKSITWRYNNVDLCLFQRVLIRYMYNDVNLLFGNLVDQSCGCVCVCVCVCVCMCVYVWVMVCVWGGERGKSLPVIAVVVKRIEYECTTSINCVYWYNKAVLPLNQNGRLSLGECWKEIIYYFGDVRWLYRDTFGPDTKQ